MPKSIMLLIGVVLFAAGCHACGPHGRGYYNWTPVSTGPVAPAPCAVPEPADWRQYSQTNYQSQPYTPPSYPPAPAAGPNLSPPHAAPYSAAPYSAAPYATAPYATAPYSAAPYATAPYATAPYATAPNAAAPYADYGPDAGQPGYGGVAGAPAGPNGDCTCSAGESCCPTGCNCRAHRGSGTGLFPRPRSGPCLYNSRIDNFASRSKARRESQRRLRDYCRQLRPSSHFCDGFEEGYCDLACGWSGLTPAVPPERYWSHAYRNPTGHQHTLDWYEGYRTGVQFAEAEGYREFNFVPLDPLAAASLGPPDSASAPGNPHPSAADPSLVRPAPALPPTYNYPQPPPPYAPPLRPIYPTPVPPAQHDPTPGTHQLPSPEPVDPTVPPRYDPPSTLPPPDPLSTGGHSLPRR